MPTTTHPENVWTLKHQKKSIQNSNKPLHFKRESAGEVPKRSVGDGGAHILCATNSR